MKTFVILLLLSNLFYFGWNQGWLREESGPARAPQPERRAPEPFRQAPQGLRLLSELGEPELEQRRRELPAAAESDTAAAAGTVEEPVAAQASEDELAENEQPESLVSDLPEPEPWCAELGLFEQQAEALALVPELEMLGMSVALDAGEVPVSSTYWVHMPDFAGEAEAQQMLEELQSKNIDSYYMRSGTLAGGISLGVFSRRDRAELVQRNLAGRGYQSEIGEVFREESRYWLDLRGSGAGLLESPEWAAFSAAHGDLNISEKVCEVVASPTQFP